MCHGLLSITHGTFNLSACHGAELGTPDGERQRTGGAAAACAGERVPRGSELCLDRCGSRDFSPSGGFFESAISGSSPAHFKQIQALCFSAEAT